MTIRAASLTLAIVLSACTMDGGEVAEKDLNKIITCTDTRDGETFQFNTNTIRNVRRGIGSPSSFEYTTLSGEERIYKSSYEAWLKCEKEENE